MQCELRSREATTVAAQTGWQPDVAPAGVAEKVILYGWDTRSQDWHGPNELDQSACGTQRILDSLRRAPGPSWYGPVNCCATGEPKNRFFALIHDLDDCILAMIYCDESRTGPAEILTVVPPSRRARLRDEFAFEFLAFASFLGTTHGDASLQIHDGIATAIREIGNSDAVVFSISTGVLTSDIDHVLSRCVEKIAIAMLRWAEE